MKITGFKFNDDKITSYLFHMGDKLCFFDFGVNDISLDILKKIDYIFISHPHYDHFSGVLRYIDEFDEHTIFLMTKTCCLYIKILFNYYFKNDKNLERKKEKFDNQTRYFYHNKEYSTQAFSFVSFQSGHVPGSAMIYMKDNKNSLFFTGDMDYNPKNFSRSYYVEKPLYADYVIIDGTHIDDNYYKKDKRTIVKYNHKEELYLVCSIDKAILIAKAVAKKFPNTPVLYKQDLFDLINLLQLQGYDCFEEFDNLYPELPYVNFKDDVIYITSATIFKKNSFDPNKLVSLHIDGGNRTEFISKCFTNHPKVLFGHYNLDQFNEVQEYCKEHNYEWIVEGEKDYEK